MAKDTRKLVDPVAESNQEVDGDSLSEEMKSLGIGSEVDSEVLSLGEVGAIHSRKTSAPHPFEGYRLGRGVLVGDSGLKVSSTFIVILKKAEEPAPDLSNEGQTIYVSKEEGGGGSPKLGTPKTVTLGTYHTRMVTNRQGNENQQVVFDRDILIGEDWYKCSIIKSHAARAQVCFAYNDRQNKAVPDKRYMLADTRQAVPLLKMFEAIYYQRTGAERAARNFDAAQETTAND